MKAGLRWKVVYRYLFFSAICSVSAFANFQDGQRALSSGDFDTAMKEWLPLAEHGDPEAQVSVGMLYSLAKGVPQDSEKAMRWYRRAADQGNAAGEFQLGWGYSIGSGIVRDDEEAVHWYKLAAAQGYAQAETNLALAFEKGIGVGQDNLKALEWYRLGAAQDYDFALLNLGSMYAEGRGVSQDYTEAARLWRKAAAKGLAAAQANIGWMYAYGKGVPQDLNEGKRWLRLAADQGFDYAKQRLSELSQNEAATNANVAIERATASFKNQDYLRAIQLGLEGISKGEDSARNAALVGTSYCLLGKESDAAMYVTQTLIQLHDDDAYLQTALYCQALILTGRFNHGEPALRPEIARITSHFLRSQTPTLLGKRQADARAWMNQVSTTLRSITGTWKDDTGIFYRLFSGMREPLMQIRLREEGLYLGEVANPGNSSYFSYAAWFYMRPQTDQFSGTFKMQLLAPDLEKHVLSDTHQAGTISLRLSEDTTTLEGQIHADPIEMQPSTRKDLDNWRRLLPEGAYKVHLTRQ